MSIYQNNSERATILGMDTVPEETRTALRLMGFSLEATRYKAPGLEIRPANMTLRGDRIRHRKGFFIFVRYEGPLDPQLLPPHCSWVDNKSLGSINRRWRVIMCESHVLAHAAVFAMSLVEPYR